ncbi:MAG: stage III sporulation protein AG [Lachnospiraceae bacterium]|nr:stage III sporulation protein AG [Lachnospiraceae bacterium]
MESLKQTIMKKDNMVILILTGILLLVIAWPVKNEENSSNKVSDLWGRDDVNMNNILEDDPVTESENSRLAVPISEKIQEEEYIVNSLEKRLEAMLASMQGVGKVKVMITLASQGEKIVEKDIPLERSNIVETDSEGGNRSTNEMYSKEETVYTINSQGDKVPYVTKETGAEVAGVSVVAQGGDQILVQKNISEVIQALFGIEEHKIKVVKMKYQE